MEVAEESPCRRYVRSNKILGRGAFKDVYKGFDQIDETEIAWNQICIEDETTLKSPQSVLSEAVLLNSLNHRNIIKCYAFWLDYDNKSINMITELFDSGSLRQYMKKLGSVEEQTIKNWGRQILQGLHYLHTNQPCIVHRDIKCDNIFVDVSSGEIKIGDFGLATAMEQRPLQVLAGTPEFMAPEYYDEEYDEAVDVYSFGMCLMEMATVECPYSECTNPAQIFKKVSTGIKPRALERVKYPEVKKMIEKCLLPASLRPSVSELLRDPFFASENMISTEREHSVVSYGDSSTVSGNNMGESLTMDCQHWSEDDSVLSGISALYNSVCLSDAKLPGSSCCQHWSEDQCLMDESVLSGISALYNSLSLSDAKLPGSSCCQHPGGSCYPSSSGDVSMNSRITFASSSDDVSKDLFILFGK